MLRYINSLATIEQNVSANAIEVGFNGYGIQNVYSETLDMATEMAFFQQVPGYLLHKSHFEDIEPGIFFSSVRNWMQRLEKQFSRSRGARVKVAVLVPKSFFIELSAEMHRLQKWLVTQVCNVTIDVFYDQDKAQTFLSHQEMAHGYYQRNSIPLHKSKLVVDKSI